MHVQKIVPVALLLILLIVYRSYKKTSLISSQIDWIQLVIGAWIGLLVYNIITTEFFHFEVTPWKKTCLNTPGNRCPQCCAPGFYGQKIGFEYSGDKERLECPNRCCPFTPLKNRENDYLDLKDSWASQENYGCAQGYANHYASLHNSWEADNYAVNNAENNAENFCGSCGSAPRLEGFCGSGCGSRPVIEGYCDPCTKRVVMEQYEGGCCNQSIAQGDYSLLRNTWEEQYPYPVVGSMDIQPPKIMVAPSDTDLYPVMCMVWLLVLLSIVYLLARYYRVV